MTTHPKSDVEADARKLLDEYEIFLEDILNGKRPMGSSWEFFVPLVRASTPAQESELAEIKIRIDELNKLVDARKDEVYLPFRYQELRARKLELEGADQWKIDFERNRVLNLCQK
jgi:hypothetical protein